MKMKKTLMMLWMAVSLMVSLVGCSSEEMDYENPDVTVFVKQLKAGTYNMKNEKGVVEVPHFTEEDIPELLKYAEDLTIIPSFPSVYNTNNGKIRLGECMLWVIESIRQGTAPSLGCRMVLANAENYEAIYFLTDDEVLDAARVYLAAAPAVPVRDTIKVAHDGIVERTPDRSALFAVQTPQVFAADLLKAALQSAIADGATITDDCSAVERLGKEVHLTGGSEENIKITTPVDLAIAEAILQRRGE